MKYTSIMIDQELAEVSQSAKPPKYALQINFPYNELGDREFELLLHQVFTKKMGRADGKLRTAYDNCGLMTGVGEKGRDVTLSFESRPVGLVQCKKHKVNLSKSDVAQEVLKFVLHYLKDKSLIGDINSFTYYLAVSTGISNEATTLIDTFNSAMVTEASLELWVNELVKKYKSIALDYQSVENELKSVLARLKVVPLLPVDITDALVNESSVVSVFFKLDQIIDKESFAEIIDQSALDMNAFTEKYKSGALNNFSRINFFGLALPKKPREVQLYSLFVKPMLKERGHSWTDLKYFTTKFSSDISPMYETIVKELDAAKIGWTSREVKFDNVHSVDISDWIINVDNLKLFDIDINPIDYLFDSNSHLVILGKPGAGKSLLTKYSICKLLEKDLGVFRNKAVYQRLPFRIELHNYNKEKLKNKANIIDCLVAQLDSDFQLTFVNRAALEKMFQNYDTVCFFDGLDEILDIQERIAVRNDIENFVKTHPRVLSVVTSRYESYDEVFFNEKDFKIYEIQDFDDGQIEDYVIKWYSVEEDDEEKRKKEVVNCIAELIKIEEELRRSPLLLSLILILYRNELELPTSKLDVYESCTRTLVETRDMKEKKLDLGLRINNKTAVYSALAYWQFTNLVKNRVVGLEFNKVKKQIKDYLVEKGEFKDDGQAEQAAEEFLEFSKLRSIFVENNFTHKTFLEYFTAYFIYTNYQSKGKFAERDEIIKKYIGKSAWHIVIELLICKIDKDQSDYEVIDDIVQSLLSSSKRDAVNFILQVAKYLRNISPDLVRSVLREAILICIRSETNNRELTRAINNHLLSLSKLSRFALVIHELVEEIGPNMKDKNDIDGFLVFILENSISSSYFDKIYSDASYKEIVENNPYVFVLINALKPLSASVYFELLAKFMHRFGKQKALESYHSRFGNNIFGITNRFNWIIMALFSKAESSHFAFCLDRLEKLGIKLSQIRRAIQSDDGKIGLTERELQNLLDKNRKSKIAMVVDTALDKYFHIKPMPVEPYYHKFANKGRRFPIPG